MRKIILASASPQRRKLMKILGLPFSVCPSRAREITQLTQGPAHLVKANALCKAMDIARRRGQGLVIGSDTVVCSHKGRLILKPKDLQEAKNNLKELMAGPHWVYSAVAVIDAESGHQELGWEKTKVFMSPLSDKAISRYHSLVSPLDKAGGFDIEGKGALFIPRIEGCYFNVVGLPLARLAVLLKKFGVTVLGLFLYVCLQALSADARAAAALPQVCHVGQCISVEVVSSLPDMERGLMYRSGLDKGKGMLFVFTEDGLHQFWMKNMKFDLDIIWINREGHIVYMGQDVPACAKDPCPVYTPQQGSRYVLEINRGFAAANLWQMGDKLDLKGI